MWGGGLWGEDNRRGGGVGPTAEGRVEPPLEGGRDTGGGQAVRQLSVTRTIRRTRKLSRVSSRTVSPSTLRRYRAERLLRQEFEGLREEVLRSVRGRLRARGVHLDRGDLEACYAAGLAGPLRRGGSRRGDRQPGGLADGGDVPARDRRASQHRCAREAQSHRPRSSSPGREHVVVGPAGAERAAAEPDLAAELDDRARLRQLFEALRSRLKRARVRSGEPSATCRA